MIPSAAHMYMQTGGPMCRWEQAWWCCGRYHTGPQMGPCTVEPVAGLGAGQMGHPERGSACQAQTGWSYYSGPRLECGAANTPTHTSSGESTLSWLTITGWLHCGLCVCFHLWFHSCFNWKYQTSCWFPMFIWENRFLISGQWFLPAFSQWANTPCASWCIIQPIFSDVFFKASSEYYL